MNWYVVYTRPKAERRVELGLREIGLEAYCPVETFWKRRRGRKARARRPLLTRYLFVGLGTDNFHLVRSVDGVDAVIANAGRPVAVSYGDWIEPLMTAETLGAFDRTQPKLSFRPGQPVRVTAGVFKGAVGKVLEARSGEERVRVMLEGIFRGGAGFDPDQLEAA
jgi:transcription antitermination factor NusG